MALIALVGTATLQAQSFELAKINGTDLTPTMSEGGLARTLASVYNHPAVTSLEVKQGSDASGTFYYLAVKAKEETGDMLTLAIILINDGGSLRYDLSQSCIMECRSTDGNYCDQQVTTRCTAQTCSSGAAPAVTHFH